MLRIAVTILTLVLTCSAAVAQVVDPQNVLIRNVHLIEPGETAEQAALRECCEELGEAGPEVKMLGTLSPIYVFASNFVVTPHVGSSPQSSKS